MLLGPGGLFLLKLFPLVLQQLLLVFKVRVRRARHRRSFWAVDDDCGRRVRRRQRRTDVGARVRVNVHRAGWARSCWWARSCCWARSCSRHWGRGCPRRVELRLHLRFLACPAVDRCRRLEDRSRGGTARGAWRRRRAATGGARSRLRGWQRRGWQRRGWQRVSWRGWKRWRRAIHSRRAAGGRWAGVSRRGQPGGRHRGQRRGGQIVELQEAPPLLLGELRRPQGVREHLCVAPARGVDRGPVL